MVVSLFRSLLKLYKIDTVCYVISNPALEIILQDSPQEQTYGLPGFCLLALSQDVVFFSVARCAGSALIGDDENGYISLTLMINALEEVMFVPSVGQCLGGIAFLIEGERLLDY